MDITNNYVPDLKGCVIYTLGDNNSLTAGISNQVVVGPSNSIVLGGQTAVTAPLNATVAGGTYLEAVLGNNIVWTNGTSVTIADGDSATVNDTSTAQAATSYKIGAGLTLTDAAVWTIITGAVSSIKLAIAAMIAVNLALDLGGGVGTAEKTNKFNDFGDSATRMGAALGAAGLTTAANLAFVARLRNLILTMAEQYKLLQHVGTLDLTQEGVNLKGNFATGTSSLTMSSPPTSEAIPQIVLNAQQSPAKSSGLSMVAGQTANLTVTLAEVSSSVAATPAAVKISSSAAALESKISVESAQISSSSGNSQMTMSETSVNIIVGAGMPSSALTLNKTDAGILFKGPAKTNFIAVDASGVYASGPGTSQVDFTEAGITLTGELIQIG